MDAILADQKKQANRDAIMARAISAQVLADQKKQANRNSIDREHRVSNNLQIVMQPNDAHERIGTCDL